MLRFLVGRGELLPADLVARYPELGRARYRRGGLPPRIAGWLLGARTVAAVTLWRWVWLGERTKTDAELLLHESRHVEHFSESAAFPLLYALESFRRGYHANRYEVDARDYAARRLRERRAGSA